MSRRSVRCVLVLILLFTPRSIVAQVETARIEGTVRDTTGAVLPGVQITLTHLQTNRSVTTFSNDTGRYVSVALPVGDYRVSAELSGFKAAVRSGIRLEVQQSAVIEFVLEVGAATDQVEVVGGAPLLNTSEAAQGQVIDNKRIVDLPLNGRDYVQLALLSAGTVQPVGGRYGGFSASGQRTTQNNYTIDGIDNNSLQAAGEAERGEAVKPSIDAIQEFRVVTNLYSAEFGRAAGGVLNLTTRSGGNAFHGTVFEFLRNDALDAKNFFDPPDSPKPPFKRNQFGFSLGGPIVKGKTFFFTDYEGTRIRESLTQVVTLPTPHMKEGDFSGLGQPIFDPLTFDPETGARRPFPGNIIPADRIDPIAR
ncbi:MAG: TonB-dependent receptor, partial [Kiloniellaceae bacterium]|nr:TonB-dependent receptor [Kiloniellaceae bacterium]